MCGRFALIASENEIKSHFNVSQSFIMKPRYNIAPSQTIPVVRQKTSEAQTRQLDFMRWGLIPSWTSDEKISVSGEKILPAGHINARIETASQKPTFSKAFYHMRLIIPASGYYEWFTSKTGKQPFYITSANHKLLGLAGIWSYSPFYNVESCCIFTTKAHEPLTRVHDRMPLILSQEEYNLWLDPNLGKEQLKKLVDQSKALPYTLYPVTKDVNNPRFDQPECIVSL